MAIARVPEPELMDDSVQVEAYASADFSESHERLLSAIEKVFPNHDFKGRVLNLGCGNGDDAFRFLRRFPSTTITAVDGSVTMLERARADLASKFPEYTNRIEFINAYIPSDDIPTGPYCTITSNSLLHHFHDPLMLWKAIKSYSKSGTVIFLSDLRRPESDKDVVSLVELYATDAPEILQRDFSNSLRAAFTLEEIQEQLNKTGLDELQLIEIGDRHLAAAGIRR